MVDKAEAEILLEKLKVILTNWLTLKRKSH